MSKFTATAQPVDGTLRHRVDVNGRHRMVTDLPTGLGGGDRGPAPHELLAATLASCVSTMVVLYAQHRGWELEGVRVDVHYDAEARPRVMQTSVCLPESLSGEQVERLQRVAENCPVRAALEAGFTFREQLSQFVEHQPEKRNSRCPPTQANAS